MFEVIICFYREMEYEDEFEMFLCGGEIVLLGKLLKIDGFVFE